MKKITLGIIATLGAAALLCTTFTSCENGSAPAAKAASDSTAVAGSIVYFDLDRVLQEYDMANDLRSVAETKINSINQEVNRRGSKLEKDIKAFQDKINKGLMTQSVAEIQGKKLQDQQNNFQQYAAQKQQEIAEEQQVMMNQIADAIKTFIDGYNAEKGYAMILTTQGDILPAPVVAADSSLDITDDILEGLNAAYVKSKAENKE
ncbi:MAG: OmpH family outer membrane protein [Bacteroidales bacterium]|jgi:outer membrane protein|nr:OmpH family outer membrane protein [Bacteroidales bacterium]MBQ6821947.1 OmpH family outer membrane protein [Bacteroidales bacterium]MBR0029430.1 OmpH family outer membrane protein [Bacteroidales bacterium]MBR0083932.1 OmpH family outer membrane protein [Bacteroidales bacterium]MBR0291189.1 OmpH family outer membrane protein [Bacteroidales bacterium]